MLPVSERVRYTGGGLAWAVLRTATMHGDKNCGCSSQQCRDLLPPSDAWGLARFVRFSLRPHGWMFYHLALWDLMGCREWHTRRPLILRNAVEQFPAFAVFLPGTL